MRGRFCLRACRLLQSVRGDHVLPQADTRTLARGLHRARTCRRAPRCSCSLLAPLHESREALVEALRRHVGSRARASTKFQLQLSLDPYPSPAYRVIYLGDGGAGRGQVYVVTAERSAAAARRRSARWAWSYVVLKAIQ